MGHDREHPVAGTFSDWAFLGMLLAVALTGFLSELLHYARMEPHREIAYCVSVAERVFCALLVGANGPGLRSSEVR